MTNTVANARQKGRACSIASVPRSGGEGF
jgi:hypothetical protein